MTPTRLCKNCRLRSRMAGRFEAFKSDVSPAPADSRDVPTYRYDVVVGQGRWNRSSAQPRAGWR